MKHALQEVIPRKVRMWLYIILAFLGLLLAAYEAAAGNWFIFLVGVIGALQASLATTDVVGDPDLKKVKDEALMRELDSRVQPDHEVPNPNPSIEE